MSDRDPLQQLADFGTGGPVNPLPAAEVRRLGERRRARRTAASAVAGVTAVLAVVVPAGLYATRDSGKAPNGTPATSSPFVTSIPDDFPLEREAFDFGAAGDRQGPAAAVEVARALPCGAEPLASAPETDRLAFVNAGGEFTDSRELLLFDDEAAARRVLEETRRAVADCATDETGPIPLVWSTEDADTGADSVTFRQGVAEEMGGTTYQYTRVGAAILAVQWAGEGGGDVGEQTAVTRAIIPAMCLFTPEGCAGGSPSSSPTVREIADDFPLADGFPEQSENGEKGYTGPNRTLDPIEYDLCGTPLPDPAHRDRLLAGYASAEDYRTRQLTTYDDADAAVAASRAIIRAFEECATEGPDADGYTSEREVRKLTLGGESWAVLDRAVFDGAETPFGSTLLVVRVGRAVLIEDHSGHAGYPTADGIQELSERLGTPIAAMCAFTLAGCAGDRPEEGTDTGATATPAATGGTTPPDSSTGGFGPSFGGLRLGDGFAQIEAAGWTIQGDRENDCIGLLPPGGGHMAQAMYQEGIGVASVSGPEGASTPEGIRSGSSREAVLAAYPGATLTGEEGGESVVVRLDGPARWEIQLHDGAVMWVFLVHDDRSCTA